MFNIFGSKSEAPAQPANPAAQNPPSITPPETPTSAANGVTPHSVGTPAEPAPLDKLATMVQPSTTPPVTPTDDTIFGKISTQDLMAAAGKMDFTKVIDKDTIAAAAAGGEQGVQALLDAMNKVSQHVYAQSAAASTALIEKAISTNTERLTERLPSALKHHAINDQIASNPILGHAASKPILDGLVASLKEANPNASADAIVAKANEYLTTYTTQFLASQAPATTADDGMDWEAYFREAMPASINKM